MLKAQAKLNNMIYLQKQDILFRDSILEDVESLAPRLREDDIRELEALGETPFEALKQSFERSFISITIVYKGIPVAMFGIVPLSLLGSKAIIWLLTAPEVEEMQFTFVKMTRPMIKMFLEYYPILGNVIDSRYTKAIQWLKLCGGKFEHSVMINGHKFEVLIITR